MRQNNNNDKETEKMDTNKVLEGLDLVDHELDSLTAEKTGVEAEIAGLAAKETALRAQLVSVTEAYETAVLRPSVRDRALAAIEAMDNAGLNEAAVRAAISSQYGKLPPPAPAKALKPPSAKPEKKITSGLPSQDIQDAILASVKAAGAKGIRMEELHDKFDTQNVEHLAVFATVKNAFLDGNVRRDGVTRGLRYFWIDKPVAEVAPAAETAPVADAPAPEVTE